MFMCGVNSLQKLCLCQGNSPGGSRLMKKQLSGLLLLIAPTAPVKANSQGQQGQLHPAVWNILHTLTMNPYMTDTWNIRNEFFFFFNHEPSGTMSRRHIVMFAVYMKSIVRFIFLGRLLGVLGRCV